MVSFGYYVYFLLVCVHLIPYYSKGSTDLNNRLHVTLFSGREIPPLVVIRSVFETSKTPWRISIHIIFENLINTSLIHKEIASYPSAYGDVLLYSFETIQQELVEDGVILAWSNDVWVAAMEKQLDEKRWLVHPARWATDFKHLTPMNHLRFYIPHFRFLKGVNKVLFLDDDIVVMKDINLAFQHPFQANRAILGSCLIPSYNPECEYFEIRRENFTYAHVPFFGFPSFNIFNKQFKSIFCADPLSNNNKWHGCIEKAGYETILRESERINGKTFSFDDKAWNFGFVMIDLNAWFRMELTEKFNKWMDTNFKLGLMPPSSIGFGLGIPYLAFAGSVQCFDPNIVLSMEGLGFMYPDEFLANNITTQDISQATYLHYTGENKPWSANAIVPFNEYWNKYWPLSRNVVPPYRSKQLVLIISDKREGSEWAMNALDHQDEICATGEFGNNFKGFPTDMLAPPQFYGKHRDQTQHCNRMAICSWRYFSAYVINHNLPNIFGSLLEDWRNWYLNHRNRTELFKGYLLAIANDIEFETDGMLKPHTLQLPCRCSRNSNITVVKVFLEWIAITNWERNADKKKALYGKSTDGRIDILRVFQELNAKFMLWQRENSLDTFQSIIRSHRTGVYFCRDEQCAHNNSKAREILLPAIDDIHWKEFNVTVKTRRMWLLDRINELGLEPLTIEYEKCRQDQNLCSKSIIEFMGFNFRNIFESSNLFKIKLYQ